MRRDQIGEAEVQRFLKVGRRNLVGIHAPGDRAAQLYVHQTVSGFLLTDNRNSGACEFVGYLVKLDSTAFGTKDSTVIFVDNRSL